MAHGYIRSFRTRKTVSRNFSTWQWHHKVRYAARVESQGVVVWCDSGWASLADAMNDTARIVAAFSITAEKGQKHRSWAEIVDEVEDF